MGFIDKQSKMSDINHVGVDVNENQEGEVAAVSDPLVPLLLQELNCPVCEEAMVTWRRPVICKNGHNVCAPCSQRTPRQCPVCRVNTTWSRNITLERIGDGLIARGVVGNGGSQPPQPLDPRMLERELHTLQERVAAQ